MNRSELLQIAKPILFNTDMVRAILEGRKTATRRVIKYQNHKLYDVACAYGKWSETYNPADVPQHLIDWYMHEIAASQYKPSDILYIRETWDNLPVNPDGTYCGYDRFYYKADGELRPAGWDNGWRSSAIMPKRAARIFLRVTDVRVERLQDITEDGVVAEGAEPFIQCPLEHAVIEPDGTTGDMCWNTDCCKQCDFFISKSYGELFGEIVWNPTIKKSDIDRYGWDANPWVWVIEFERVEVTP